MWGLLGLFVLVLLNGALWGASRGAKRTFVRILTFIIFFAGALFLTPVISGVILNANIKLPIDGGKTVQELVNGVISSNATFTSAAEHMTEVKTFALNAPLVVLNIVVFILLLIIFRLASWIFYKIIAGRVAPLRDADGEKIRHKKWSGALLGLVQGFVLFFFFMIPINGLIGFLNQVDTYNPRLASVNVMDANLDPAVNGLLNDVNKAAREINQGEGLRSGVQGSAYDIITEYTGMQALSGFAMDYLFTVPAGPGKSVNLKADLVRYSEITRDAMAVKIVINNIDGISDLTMLTPNDYDELRSIVNKAFTSEALALALDSDIAGFLSDIGVINGADLLIGANADQKARYGAQYGEDIITALDSFLSSENLRTDLITAIDLAEAIFSDHYVDVTEGYNVYKQIDALDRAAAGKDPAAIKDACDELIKALTHVKYGNDTLIDHVFKTATGTNIFKAAFLNPETENLYTLPLMFNMGFARPEDARIQNPQTVAVGLSAIVIDVLEVGPTVFELADAKNLGDVLGVLNGSTAVGDISTILDQLTNKMGTKTMLRNFLAAKLDGLFAGTPTGAIDISTFTSSMKSRLLSSEDIAWTEELSGIVDMVNTLNDLNLMDVDNLDPQSIIDALMNGENNLLDKLAGSELLSDIVVGVVESQVNTMLKDKGVDVSISFESGNPQEIVAIVADAYEDIAKIMEDPESVDLSSIEDIAEAFGGTETIEKLAEQEVKITLPDTISESDIQDYANNWSADEELKNKVLGMFGISAGRS
jgi:hypothetical protein